MNWKFFELTKFKDSEIYKDHLINRGSNIKLQWLEFLVDCAKQPSEPNRNEIIKKGYGIMNKAIWKADQETLYLKRKMDEASFDYAMKEQIREAFEAGKLEAEREGEIIGKLKGEIKTVKALLKYKIDTSEILKELQYLNKNQKTEENIKYISDHIEDTESVICNELGLLDEFSNEQSEIIGASGLDSSSIMES